MIGGLMFLEVIAAAVVIAGVYTLYRSLWRDYED